VLGPSGPFGHLYSAAPHFHNFCELKYVCALVFLFLFNKGSMLYISRNRAATSDLPAVSLAGTLKCFNGHPYSAAPHFHNFCELKYVFALVFYSFPTKVACCTSRAIALQQATCLPFCSRVH
jgi:hypothetical protein